MLLTASLNIYRAILPPESLVAEPIALPPVSVPAMGLWSTGDLALTEEQMTGSQAHVVGRWRYERLERSATGYPGGSDAVNALLLDFLDSAPTLRPEQHPLWRVSGRRGRRSRRHPIRSESRRRDRPGHRSVEREVAGQR
jgi:hypothetical protein